MNSVRIDDYPSLFDICSASEESILLSHFFVFRSRNRIELSF